MGLFGAEMALGSPPKYMKYAKEDVGHLDNLELQVFNKVRKRMMKKRSWKKMLGLGITTKVSNSERCGAVFGGGRAELLGTVFFFLSTFFFAACNFFIKRKKGATCWVLPNVMSTFLGEKDTYDGVRMIYMSLGKENEIEDQKYIILHNTGMMKGISTVMPKIKDLGPITNDLILGWQ